MTSQTTLVATLGGQPQVITFMLDLLLARGYRVDQVVIIYLDGEQRYQQAFRILAGEFAGDQYCGRPCHLRPAPVRIGQRMVSDAFEPAQIDAIRTTFDALLSALKSQNQAVHLGLSGGRRIMSLVGLSAAMRYLTPMDRAWHIYTPENLAERARDGAVLHAQPEDGVRLIEVPFVPWVSLFPGLAPLLERGVQPAGAWLNPDDERRCAAVWEKLTPRQRDVLPLLAEGLTRAEMKDRLGVSLATVDSHKEVITGLCKEMWAWGWKSIPGALCCYWEE